MRGIAQLVPPSAIQRRLDRIRARTAPPQIIEAKLRARDGHYAEALVLMVEVGAAEEGHLLGHRRWIEQHAEMQTQSIEEFV